VGSVHHFLAAEIPQVRHKHVAVVHRKWYFADADAVCLAFFKVKLLAHKPNYERGFACRRFTEKDDFDFVEALSIFAEFFKVIAHGLWRVAGDFDWRADEGAVPDVNK